jgi:hypothetical protein
VVKSRLVDPAVRVVQAGLPAPANGPPTVVADRAGAAVTQASARPAAMERTSP